MRNLPNRWLLRGGITVLASAVGCWWFFSPSRSSSGRVRQAWAADSPQRLSSVLYGRIALKNVRWREVLSKNDSYLHLGPVAMEWSMGNNERGYLYFSSTDLKRGPWEFAPCSQ